MEHLFLMFLDHTRRRTAHLLKSWVRIPPGAWIFVCCECRVLSGRGLCDELITRPQESYRLWCVVVYDLETSRIGAPYIYIYDISNLRVKCTGMCGHEQDVRSPKTAAASDHTNTGSNPGGCNTFLTAKTSTTFLGTGSKSPLTSNECRE